MLSKFFNKIEKIIPQKYRWILNHDGFKRYFANTGWLFFGQFFSLGISFLIGVLVARHLGPELYGTLNYVISFTTIFGIFFCFGIDSIMTRELIKYPEKENKLLGTFWGIKLFGGILTLISATALAFIIHLDYFTTILIFIYSIFFIIQSINVVGLFFQAKVMSKNISLSQIIGNSFSFILKIIWLIFSSNLFLLIAIYLIDILFNGLLLVYYYKKSGRTIKKWRFDWNEAKKISLPALPLMFSGLAILSIMKIDQVLIGQMIDRTAVGLYAVADKLTEIWDFVPRLICLSLFPAIVNAKKIGNDLYKNRLKLLYKFIFILSLAALVFCLVFSRIIISWLFGPNYYESINLFRIYAFSLPGIFLFVVLNQQLLIENREKKIFISNIFCLIVNVLLNLILIPRFGLSGAAWATVITFMILPLMMFSFSSKTVIKKNKIYEN